MAELPSNYVISWWYSSETKLGLYFNNFALPNNQPQELDPNIFASLTANNGMAASLREEYKYSNLITSHPVEDSVSISDHIINMPTEISISGAVTALSTLLFISKSLDFSQLGDAVQLLESLGQCRTGISITTGLLYGRSFYRADNLACENMTIVRNETTGKSTVQFSAVFRQLNIVSSSGGTTTGKTAPATPVADRSVGG